MNTTPDGQFQTYSTERRRLHPRALLRRRPAAAAGWSSDLSDDQTCARCPRGGHDYRKVYAAFEAAIEHEGQPTVILAHTIKGWTLGKDFEGRNATHQMKKLTKAELKELPRPALPADPATAHLEAELPPYYHPGEDSEEIQYMQERRRRARRLAAAARGPRQAAARCRARTPTTSCSKGSGKQSVATTMAFVRLLKDLMKDKDIGARFVPIIPDEARTFGMDSMFPTAKIYSPPARPTRPVDRELLLSYKESHDRARSCTRASPRPARWRSVIAAGTSLRHARRAHDPGLRLLLDVRLPAHRRPDVGVRRPAGPRLPARRHRRPHHAERRGPAARGRALACCSPRPTRPAWPTTRRSPTRSPTSSRTGCERMYGDRGARTSSTTSPSTTSRSRSRPNRTCRARGGRAARALPLPPRRRPGDGDRPAPSCWPAASAMRRALRGPASCSPRTGAWPPTSGRRPPGTSCAATPWPCDEHNLLHPDASRGCRASHRR